jgi:hypothetical protein
MRGHLTQVLALSVWKIWDMENLVLPMESMVLLDASHVTAPLANLLAAKLLQRPALRKRHATT